MALTDYENNIFVVTAQVLNSIFRRYNPLVRHSDFRTVEKTQVENHEIFKYFIALNELILICSWICVQGHQDLNTVQQQCINWKPLKVGCPC